MTGAALGCLSVRQQTTIRRSSSNISELYGTPPPPWSKSVLLTVVLKQAFAGMEAGAEDYLSYARSAGASGGVEVFLTTCALMQTAMPCVTCSAPSAVE